MAAHISTESFSTHVSESALPGLRRSDNNEASIDGPPKHWARRWGATTLHHIKKHTGLGAICAVAYFDPGNWSVDLQAGSEYGYKLLAIVLLSGIMAVILQSMASRLGTVTGLDLATHCRLLLYNRTKRPRLFRWLILYPLYALCEIAIISTDLAELLGSATALSLLFPALPLWAGVLITSCDVFIVLAFCSPQPRSRPQRAFEFLVIGLVLAVFIPLAIVIGEVQPNWIKVFDGFVPSKTIFSPGALYTSIGIIGATVMPHGLFLGSALATQDRVSEGPFTVTAMLKRNPSDETLPGSNPSEQFGKARTEGRFFHNLSRYWKPTQSDADEIPDGRDGYATWNNRSQKFVKAHLKHGIIDIVMSLLGFAVIINSLILIIAGATFFYKSGASDAPADLFEAHDLISSRVGTVSGVLFALALLCAGESAGITATLAGQVVSEGFIRWRVPPLLRRCLTRLIGLLPSMLVATVMGKSGLNTLLVLSQVILSFVLPFVAFPLVWITSNSKLMTVTDETVVVAPAYESEKMEVELVERTETRQIDHSNGKIMMSMGYAIWLVVLVANAYVLVELAMGNDGCEFSFLSPQLRSFAHHPSSLRNDDKVHDTS